MFNIVIFGPPGAGKGTQASLIKSAFGLKHISTGEIIRREMASQSEIGEQLRSFVSQGKLVPDETVTGIMESEMEKHDGSIQGYIFDGFPRTTKQAESFDKILENIGSEIDLVIGLKVSEPELVKRLLLRGKESGRSDDNEDIIENRLRVYKEETQPLLSYYENKGKLAEIDGEGSIEEIFGRIKKSIEDRMN